MLSKFYRHSLLSLDEFNGTTMKEFSLYLNLFSGLYFIVLVYFILKKTIGSYSLKWVGYLSLMVLPTFVNNVLVLGGWMSFSPFLFFFFMMTAAMFGLFFKIHIDLLLKQKWNKFHICNSFNYAYLGFIIVVTISFYLKNNLERTAYFKQLLIGDFPLSFELLNLIFMLIQLIYFIDTGITVLKKEKRLDQTYSNLFIERRRYALRFWLIIIGLYIGVSIAYLFIPAFITEYIILPIAINIVYLYIFTHVHNYSKHYLFSADEEDSTTKANPTQIATSKEVSLIGERIKKLLNEEQIYLDANLTLDELSEKLSIPRYKLPYVMKKSFEVNFNHLINSYRIAHAKKLLMVFDPKLETIEGVGYQSGFNRVLPPTSLTISKQRGHLKIRFFLSHYTKLRQFLEYAQLISVP